MLTNNSPRDIFCVWLRYFNLYKKNLAYAITTTFVEPLLLLFSLGFGLGSLIGSVHTQGMEVSYRQFVFTGLIAQTLLFKSFFEAAYGSYFRIYYQKVFHNIAVTPITLSEVLWGELLSDATQGTFASAVVLLIGIITGDFHLLGAIAALPFCFFASLLFSGSGLLVSGISKTINEVSYPHYLFVFPMFLFCGVFFPIEQMPTFLQIIAWVFPLTSIISIVRTLTVGFPFEWFALPISLFWLIFFVTLSRRSIVVRIIN